MRLQCSLACLWLALACPTGQATANAQTALRGDAAQDAGQESARPKNIVFILTDDQDLVLDSPSYMPLLKKHIIDQGKTYENHFTTTAICCPSRVALLTGKQPHNTNVTDVSPPYGGFPKFVSQGLNEAYLPVWLQEAGYATYYTGKLFNAHTVSNYDNPYPAGWTGTDFLLDPGTYSYLYPIYQRDQDKPVQHDNEHTTDLITKKTRRLLDDAIKGAKGSDGKPFFVGVAPVAPHSQMDANRTVSPNGVTMTEPIPLKRHAHLFSDAKVPRTDNFNPDVPSGASWVRDLGRLNDTAVEYLDHYYRQRMRALQGVDELIEQVVNQLDEAGVLEDTYIVFSSDNGYHIGQHRLPPGKECGYEEDIRVPLYIRGPGISKGSTEKAVTTHIDLVPTLFTIADIAPREDFDGTAIPLLDHGLSKPKITRHEHVAVEFWGTAIAEGLSYDGKATAPNNTYKAVRIIGEGYDLYYSVWCNNDHELYDLMYDPGQMYNLYVPPEDQDPVSPCDTLAYRPIQEVANRLDALMMVLKQCKGSVCIEPWKTLHPDGDVKDLTDALSKKFDKFYSDQVMVVFDRCELGYIVDAEGPQSGYEYRDGTPWHYWT